MECSVDTELVNYLGQVQLEEGMTPEEYETSLADQECIMVKLGLRERLRGKNLCITKS